MAIGDFTRIRTNINAYNALSAIKAVNRNFAKIQLKLATGLRINEVADDPAGFVISQRLHARSRGLSVALDNVGTAKNVLAIAEGGLLNISDILLTIKEKVTQAASDTLGPAERNAIKTEIDQLTEEIDDIVDETSFNDRKLIDGTYTGISYQTGERPTDTLKLDLDQNAGSSGIGVASTDVSQKVYSASAASSALENVNQALNKITEIQQKVGAVSSRLTVKENTIETAIVNTDATRSRIRDADLARTQLESVRIFILQQTSMAMLSQANLLPYMILSLFRR